MAKSGLIVSQVQDITTVSFQEPAILDMAVIDAVAKELYDLVDQQNRRKLILNFRTVKFLSSQMIGVLLKVNSKTKALKGKTILCCMQPNLQHVFKVTKLDSVLNFNDSEETAVRELANMTT